MNEELENKYKTTFKDREIHPSKDAWNQLEFLLDEEETPLSTFSWSQVLKIAAILFIFIFSCYWIFNDSVNTNQPKIAEHSRVNAIENNTKKSKVDVDIKATSTIKNRRKEKFTQTEAKHTTLKAKKQPSISPVKTNIETNNSQENETRLVFSDPKKVIANNIDQEIDDLLATAQQKLNEQTIKQIENISDQEIATLLAKASQHLHKKNQTQVTDKEVEMLLAKVMKKSDLEIQNKVLSKSLLAEIEAELNQDIYARIYLALHNRLEKFKRNQKNS